MKLRFSSQDDFFLATAAGTISAKEVQLVFKNAIDIATARGFDKIVMDFLAATGEVSVMDLYSIGKATAEYSVSKSIYPKVAVVVNPPTVIGFVADVASNRGLISSAFPKIEPALNWLRAFGSKAFRA